MGMFMGLGLAQESMSTQMTAIQVHPGMEIEFENFMKAEVIPALRKGGVKEMSGWKTAVFGEAGRYIFTSPIGSLAEFDNPNPLIKAVGQEGMPAIMAKTQKPVSGMRTFTMMDRPDLGITPPDRYVAKLGFQVRATIAPGREVDYENVMKAMMEVLKKTNAKGVLAGKVGLGGNPNEYHSVVLLDSFADMQKFAQAFAKEIAAARLPSVAGILLNMEYAVYARIPELSIQPPAQ